MVPSAPGALAGIPEEAEEFDGEVSLSSSEGGADGHLGMADTLRWGRPASVSSGLGVTLQHVQEALCLLCDESGGPPLWRHEDGRHCVAGGSKDPYHIASLVWAQLVGKGSTQVDSVHASSAAL